MSCIASPTSRECSPSTNPNRHGRCFRCDHEIPTSPAEPRRRNIDLERQLTEEAARGAADPSRLRIHAETRALTLSSEYVSDPMLVAAGRDRIRDVREELADGRNHLVWWIEEHTDDPTVNDKMIALRFLALAYERLQDDD